MARFSGVFPVCLCLLALGGVLGQPGRAQVKEEPRLLPLQAVKAVAAREGLIVTSVYAEAPRRLVVLCAGPMDRSLFLKRASLVSFAAFQSWAAPVEVVFEHTHLGVTQRCRVRQTDLDAYLKERISREEYDRRLAYQRERPGTAVPPPPPLPVATATPFPQVSPTPVVRPQPTSSALLSPSPGVTPAPAAAPVVASSDLPASDSAAVAPSPATPTPGFFVTPPPTPSPFLRPGAEVQRDVPGEWRAAYLLGLGGSFFDALSLEYSRPLLPTLDVRPTIWMIGGLAPRTLFARTPSTIDGVSLAVDLLGTGHRLVKFGEVSFEGGVGVRASVLQGGSTGLWPATHLRVGTRWRSLSIGLRYPLLARPNDPTALWDLSLGYHWSLPSSDGR